MRLAADVCISHWRAAWESNWQGAHSMLKSEVLVASILAKAFAPSTPSLLPLTLRDEMQTHTHISKGAAHAIGWLLTLT